MEQVNQPWQESWLVWSHTREGERDVGVNTVIGYFAQHQAEELNPTNEVLAEVEEVCENNPDANPRAALGALLF